MKVTTDIKCDDIDSTMIHYLHYHGDNNTGYLGVIFSDNYSYVYDKVGLKSFMAVIESQSVGKAFNALIKDVYGYTYVGICKGFSPLEKINIKS